MLKKLIAVLSLSVLLTACAAPATSAEEPANEPVSLELPAPRSTEGDFSIDASAINQDNLDQYLGRDDVVYIDLRDYNDYAKKHFKNFEVIPFFAYIWNENAHTDESMVQIYGGSLEEPVATYTSSEAILNTIFPMDKTIFLMCQSGGRVAMMMNILEDNGYDMNKIYNIGGLAQYTDSKYRDYITDTPEFIIDVNYTIEGATRN